MQKQSKIFYHVTYTILGRLSCLLQATIFVMHECHTRGATSVDVQLFSVKPRRAYNEAVFEEINLKDMFE